MKDAHLGQVLSFVVIMLMATVALVLIGCSDPIGPPREPFSLTVTVFDPSSGPIAGLRIGRVNYLDGCDPFVQQTGPFGGLQPEPIDTLLQNFPNPICGSTAILFGAAKECYGILELVNWRGESVRILTDGLLGAGAHIRLWDMLDSEGERVIDGVYTYRLTLQDRATSDILYMDSLYCTINCRYDETTWDIGSTNNNGVFKTDNIDFFPGLINRGPQPCVDHTRQPCGTCHFTDEVTIVIRTAPPPGGSGWIYVMYRDVRLIKGINSFTYQWAPDDSIFVTQ